MPLRIMDKRTRYYVRFVNRDKAPHRYEVPGSMTLAEGVNAVLSVNYKDPTFRLESIEVVTGNKTRYL